MWRCHGNVSSICHDDVHKIASCGATFDSSSFNHSETRRLVLALTGRHVFEREKWIIFFQSKFKLKDTAVLDVNLKMIFLKTPTLLTFKDLGKRDI